MEFRKYPRRWFSHLLTGPFIYSVIVPVVFLDIILELYHRISFPVYGIPYVKRSQYIRIDRHRLSYLNWYEKINCMYCGYVNGFFFFASRVAGETENYWCGIKHKKIEEMKEQAHHQEFLEYGDREAFASLVSQRPQAEQSATLARNFE